MCQHSIVLENEINKFSGHTLSMPISLFSFCRSKTSSSRLRVASPASVHASQLASTAVSFPRPCAKENLEEVGFSFPLTAKQGLKCVYCPHTQYSVWRQPREPLSCTLTLACTPISVCLCLSPSAQLEYRSSLFHPVLKSAESWCPDVRLGRRHSLGWCHSPSFWHDSHRLGRCLPAQKIGNFAKLFDHQVQSRQSLITFTAQRTIKASFPVVFPLCHFPRVIGHLRCTQSCTDLDILGVTLFMSLPKPEHL